MADFHVACVPAGASVVWVALLMPGTRGRRALRALSAAALFAVVAFAIAPVAWMRDAQFVLAGYARGAARPTLPLSDVVHVLSSDFIALCSILGVGAWLGAAATGRRSLRRTLDVSIAVMVPALVTFALAVRHGVPDGGGKYLAHIKPAAALGLAAPIAALGEAIARDARRAHSEPSPRRAAGRSASRRGGRRSQSSPLRRE